MNLLAALADPASAAVREQVASRKDPAACRRLLVRDEASRLLAFSAAADRLIGYCIPACWLTLVSSKHALWSRPDAQEHLKRLLVDPDSPGSISRGTVDRRAAPADHRRG